MKMITGCEETTEHISDLNSEVTDEVVVEVNSLHLGEMELPD